MKVLGINGSPRKNGNTELLVREAMVGAQEAGAEVEILNIAGQVIAPCEGCELCADTAECCLNDDMQKIYPMLLEADGIFLGTPVYFWSVCGQVKVFIDRTYALSKGRKLRGKVGGIAVVAARAGCTSTYTLLTTFFATHHRMTVAGGVIGYAQKEGDIVQDKQAMRDARLAGKAMVRAIQRT